jgi:hypothetical protein
VSHHGLRRGSSHDIDRYLRLAAHAANLTRLTGRIAEVSHHSRTHRGLQLRAACTAYDQTLLLAATELGIETGLRTPLSAVDRLTLEAELVAAGLRW